VTLARATGNPSGVPASEKRKKRRFERRTAVITDRLRSLLPLPALAANFRFANSRRALRTVALAARLDAAVASTVAPISKVGPQGHSPFLRVRIRRPAGRCGAKSGVADCREADRARAAYRAASPLAARERSRALAAHASLSLSLFLFPSRLCSARAFSSSHARDAPRSAPRSTTH